MSGSGLSATVWGSPTATKHAILLHGIIASSQTWWRVGPALAEQGYLVTAPDLLGHGTARRGGADQDYKIAALAEEVLPFFTTGPKYDLVIAHSLGCLVVLHLLSHLSSKPTRVIFVDPPLYQTRETAEKKAEQFADEATNVKSIEAYMAANPRWKREDAACKVFAAEMCDAAAARGILMQNIPWDFGHLLSNIPASVDLTIQAADPSLDPCFRVEEAADYPRVKTQVIRGCKHSIQREAPEVVLEAALA
ncbi:Alpha/Beta hydrolase protein [Hygrophoropsis aurantiaca]|uniref:Alpha/Beta hydrolase protein n=1 Tax=Hygrophoropsis aurantiaca TaxID=72124 RepID=A0ACB8AQL0_9AGAM|nr:Alpha/Beta hydrolase protein [Hygrophoropsis aurantiaca]